MGKTRLEICCGSAADVWAAEQGGADQVELNSDLFHGGLTPSIGSLIYAKHITRLPIFCMVRPREGGFCYTAHEYGTMLEDAKQLLARGADGLVFGFLREDGTVDRERCEQMLEIIGEKQSVFHRAIDVVPDVFAALDVLMELGITRVLTSGQAPSVPQGIGLIKEMITYAAGRIEIMPGAGIKPDNAAWVQAETGAQTLHASALQTAYDRSAMGNPAIFFGGAVYPPEDRYRVGDAKAVGNIRKAIQ